MAPRSNAPHATLTRLLDDAIEYLSDLRAAGTREVYLARPLPMMPADQVASQLPLSAAAMPPLATSADLQNVAVEVGACKKCALHKTRTKVVPGQGHPAPELLFVGEAPGEDEDLQGLAFVGRAGQLLTRMIEAMGFRREEVFIANILKCRPPNNRKPTPEEIAACRPFLLRQIAALHPKVIVTLGATALEGLLKMEEVRITRARGNWLEFEGIPVMPTYHPSYLLRNPAAKNEVWLDLQAVLKKLGRTPPPRSKRSA